MRVAVKQPLPSPASDLTTPRHPEPDPHSKAISGFLTQRIHVRQQVFAVIIRCIGGNLLHTETGN